MIFLQLWITLTLGLQAFANPDNATLDASKAIDIAVEKYQLPNGLTVLLHQDRSVPLISYQTFFRVGSRDEEEGYSGIAHLFEHMMFKGAKRYKNSDFDRLLKANGGSYNAFTTFDLTGYYIDLPSQKLELAIDLESDRMESLQINDKHLASEREVVKEERRFRYDNSVQGTLWLNMITQLFTQNNYRWPVIGYMEDLNRTTVEKCREFFRQYYAPNNAIVIVAGDFDVPSTKKLIEKYYSGIKAQTIVRPVARPEPPITSPRKKIIEKDIDTEVFSLSFSTVSVGAEEAYALDMLGDVLAEGNSSRLYKRLVRDLQLVDSIGSYNYSLKEAGAFITSVSMKAESSEAMREKTLKVIEGELYRVKTQKVSEVELQRAKVRVMKNYVDSLKRINDRAKLLGHSEVFYGDYKRVLGDLNRYNAVTTEQIRAVAQKYLRMERSSLVVVTKAKKKTAKSVCVSVGGGKC